MLFNGLLQYLAYRCYMAAFRLPEGTCQSPAACSNGRQRGASVASKYLGRQKGLGRDVANNVVMMCTPTSASKASRASIQQLWETYNPTGDDILRERIQEFSKRYQEYIKCCQHKFGFVSAEDEIGQICPSGHGDDAVTTTTIGQPTPEVHNTATTRVITITRMWLLVSITFYVRYYCCMSSGCFVVNCCLHILH